MAVAPAHRLGLMPHELVDDPLINAGRCQVAGEAVTIRMEANLEPVTLCVQAPIGAPHRLPEAAIGPIVFDRFERIGVTDNVLPVWSVLSPDEQFFFQLGMGKSKKIGRNACAPSGLMRPLNSKPSFFASLSVIRSVGRPWR